MFTSYGKCSCGQAKVAVSLPESLENYSPRQCDCDFCLSRNIMYLSHPNGELEIESKEPLEIQRQGSNQAGFITCHKCKSVIAASLQLEDSLVGALNSTLLSNFSSLQKPTIVSPKVLDAKEKVVRWQALWLNIRVNNSHHV